MYKNLVRIILFACLLVLAAANIAYYIGHKALFAEPQKTGQSAAATAATKPAKGEEEDKTRADYIHGRAIYDTRAALPPQAVLDIKLTASAPAGQNKAAIVAESRQQLSGRSPPDWALPIALSRLEAQKSYSLRATISSGDTLLFVNTAPMPVDHNRAAYIMRLEKLDSGEADKGSRFIGTNWRADIILGKPAISRAETGFYIDPAAKTDPAEAGKRYAVSGSGGCNHYTGSVILDESGETVRFSPLAAGFIMCAPALARQEADFITAMAEVRRYKFDENGALYLIDAEERPLARFIPH